MTLEASLTRIHCFENRRDGAFLAFLRQILLNKIRDEARRVAALPVYEEVDERLPIGDPSPLDEQIGRDRVEAYERALARLDPRQREAVSMRLEMRCTYEEIAAEIGGTSNAARMLISRALVRLAEEMRVHRE